MRGWSLAKRVFITGCGIITSIGNNLEENLASLTSGRSGIGKITILETVHSDTLPAGQIGLKDEELARVLGIGFREGLSRTALLGMIAAEEAFHKAGCTMHDGLRTGLISGSTVGGMVSTEKYYPDFLENDSRNAWIGANDSSESTERIAYHLGIRDFVSTINTACSSSANVIMTGARLIQSGMLDRVVVGGTDALSLFTLNGFNTLMIYDREPCKPFDEQRNGLNLGEGAAYLVLEGEDTTGQRLPFCELRGYGNSTDAHHQTALSPEGTGPYLAMKLALERGRLKPGDISYLNVHGTATVNNDLSEGSGMLKVFGEKIPPFSSTKPFTGHLLGASGAVEAVFSILSIRHDTIWPNLNFTTPMKEFDFTPARQAIKGSGIRHVLSNSFGFGGNNTTLAFSAI
jgi:3-oxoacyl-[acyl-carrier-protein] synthase II